MKSNLADIFIIVIGIVSVLSTIVLSLRVKGNKVLKYLPAILVGGIALIYCILITIVNYNQYGRFGYTGIVYVVVLITTSPSILLSIIIAAVFDFLDFYRKRKQRSNTI